MAIDAQGYLYVTNTFANTVTVYAPDWPGGNTAPVKTLTGTKTRLSLPEGIAFDSGGLMYVANADPNSNLGSIMIYAKNWADGNTAPLKVLSGTQTGVLGGGGLGFDADGNLYLAQSLAIGDEGPDEVSVFAPAWTNCGTTVPITCAPSPLKVLAGANTGLSAPSSPAFDSSGYMYIANSNGTNTVTVYPPDWASGNTPPIQTLSAASLDSPAAVAIDDLNNLYVVNSGGDPGYSQLLMFHAGWGYFGATASADTTFQYPNASESIPKSAVLARWAQPLPVTA